jgi:hypothetical protein
VIPRAYDAVLDLVLEKIKSRFVDEGRFVCAIKNAMALTSDFWTDPMNRSFICATGSYIDEDWKLHSTLLNVSNVTEQHTGDNIAAWFVDLLKRMKIDVCPSLACFLSSNSFIVFSYFCSGVVSLLAPLIRRGTWVMEFLKLCF